MITWNLSGGIVHRSLLIPFIDALDIPNVAISVHDGFSGLSWSAGRGRGSTILPDVLDRTLEDYRQRDVGFNLLFSNHLIGPKDLDNAYGNRLLEKLHHERNGVVVCDGVLGDYVRKHYPKYKLIRSVIQSYLDEVIYRDTSFIVSYFKEKLETYDQVVVPSELNLRFDILDQLDKSRLEFLVNNNCFWHCPYAIKHYTEIARGFTHGGRSSPQSHVCLAKAAAFGPERDALIGHLRKYDAVLDEFGNPIQQPRFGQRITLKKSWNTPKEVGVMQQKGCVNFKLQGRDSAIGDFETTLRTMVVNYGTL